MLKLSSSSLGPPSTCPAGTRPMPPCPRRRPRPQRRCTAPGGATGRWSWWRSGSMTPWRPATTATTRWAGGRVGGWIIYNYLQLFRSATRATWPGTRRTSRRSAGSSTWRIAASGLELQTNIEHKVWSCITEKMLHWGLGPSSDYYHFHN